MDDEHDSEDGSGALFVSGSGGEILSLDGQMNLDGIEGFGNGGSDVYGKITTASSMALDNKKKMFEESWDAAFGLNRGGVEDNEVEFLSETEKLLEKLPSMPATSHARRVGRSSLFDFQYDDLEEDADGVHSALQSRTIQTSSGRIRK
eukprot:TRINITY_DN3504_c1_g1_i1.p1 TRINITY_DN3504_c1_g1~~TRINITY_DN3504_c1_g1_i1.p1  ORF type:complete len:148 (+),score=52.70 TRINITY_DN3504_c1_g1_i1:31-474(+)